jgi:SNF2 family DNA or RNA helicase
MSVNIVDRIEDYLDINVPSEIIDRGDNLFRKKRIESAEINKTTGSGIFEVRGTTLYVVVVKGLNETIKTSCNCPYDWGPVCKHQVAALRYIQEIFGGRPEEKEILTIKDANNVTGKIQELPKPVLRYPDNPYVIKDYKRITYDLLDKLTDNWYDYGNIETKLFAENKIHFNYYSYSSIFLVKFWIANKELHTTCNCGKKVKKLCPHQSQILTEIANSEYPDIFDQIRPENLKVLKNNILDRYGLRGKDFNRYFSLNYINNEISWELKEGYETLLSVKGDDRSHAEFFKASLGKLNHNLIKVEAPVPESGKYEKRSIGFAFIAYTEMDLSTNDELEIVVLTGKENKTGDKLVSHIKRISGLSFDERPVITKNQKTILEKIRFFEESKELGLIPDGNDDFFEKEKHIFEFLNKVIPLIEKEKYLFIIPEYEEFEKVRKSDIKPIIISSEHLQLKFEFYNDDTFLYLSPKLIINGIEQDSDKIDISNSHFLYTIIDDALYLHKSISQSMVISQFNWKPLTMANTEANRFFSDYVIPVSKLHKIDFKSDLFSINEKNINPLKKQIFLSEFRDNVVFKPVVKYGGDLSFEPADEGNSMVLDKENNVTIYNRNEEYEKDFLEFVSELHPDFQDQKNAGRFFIPADILMDDFWFFDAYEKLEKANVEVFGLKDLKTFKYSPYRAKISSGIKSGQDWFEVDVEVAFGDMTLDLKSIRRAVMRQEKYVQLKDGSVGILPEEWLNKLQRYFRAGEIKDDKLQISKLKFSIIDELFEDIDNTEIIKELAEKRRKLKNIENISTIRKPREITATLRDYQKEGLNWLNVLNEMGWGGILADDMGLGKTLQVLTLLQKQVKKTKKPNLIIVPTTLLFNWEIELKKFAPKLTYHFYYGINRDKEIKYFKKYNIILTTYGVLVRDIKFLKELKFNYIILDESQAIKNPSSLRYKAAFLLKAANKLTLTGTPIENSTFDLYAQMNFVNPGFLGQMESFREYYSKAIDKEGNVEVSRELSKLISPFILRRTKEQVAKDLPEKTENILFCEMGDGQRKVYDAFRNKYRNQLLGRIETEGLGKSKIYVLEGLMKLRQICDSPAILSDEEDYGHESVKIEELVRHINEKTSNHKILVFSQFVRMLKLIKDELIRDKIDFEYLDGQSSKKQREESVNRFQENPECRVFLISLKAGGVGLNLTAADYVYIVDPWWNPAVENQAIDRTHRIGQGKKVFAYRMICKNTVEEKILNLQAKKKKIAADIISTDESLVKKLTVKDIKELFS